MSIWVMGFISCKSNTTTETTSTKSSNNNNNMSEFEINKTNEEWKQQLTAEQYAVLREKGTERPFTGKFEDHYETGIYICAGCGNELFKSDTKFDAGCGWPSFYEALDKTKIIEKLDKTHGMTRLEILCAKCGGHLGHVFNDGPQDKTGLRYCVNSLSLDFKKRLTDSTQTK
jgi:peptide-methionine (R)-S-oxide reductase